MKNKNIYKKAQPFTIFLLIVLVSILSFHAGLEKGMEKGKDSVTLQWIRIYVEADPIEECGFPNPYTTDAYSWRTCLEGIEEERTESQEYICKKQFNGVYKTEERRCYYI